MSSLWKPIDGYESYEVSDDGRIRFLGGMRNTGRGAYFHPACERKIVLSATTRYPIIVLSHFGKRTTKSVHRLVAEAFIEKVPGKRFVNHKNGIRHDNRASNLEWVTVKENSLHKTRILGRQRGEETPGSKLHEAQVLSIFLERTSAERLAEKHKVSVRTIYSIKSGTCWGWLTSRRNNSNIGTEL